MSTRTVDWTTPRPPDRDGEDEGLRERKKRLMRQRLSDTATQMFMERGFDAVRVAEVAAACGVSEKTVFNYFPTKESLILDRLEATMASLRTGLAAPGDLTRRGGPADPGRRTGRYDVLARQPGQPGPGQRRNPAFRHPHPGHTLAACPPERHDGPVRGHGRRDPGRTGRDGPHDPEPQIAATALLGLWRIQYLALSKYLDGTLTPAQVHQAVTADVRRAARLIETGLNSLAA